MRVVVKNIPRKGNHKHKGPEVETIGGIGNWNFEWKGWVVVLWFFLEKKYVFNKNNLRNSITDMRLGLRGHHEQLY